VCDRCGWREVVPQVRAVVAEKHPELGERQQYWLETIGITIDDDRHCTDHQKAVIRRILRERKIPRWRMIPKATDKSEWSEARKKRHVERKKLNRKLRDYGRF
jgi:hypothetical protein